LTPASSGWTSRASAGAALDESERVIDQDREQRDDDAR
jgi:hypothetical protein